MCDPVPVLYDKHFLGSNNKIQKIRKISFVTAHICFTCQQQQQQQTLMLEKVTLYSGLPFTLYHRMYQQKQSTNKFTRYLWQGRDQFEN